MNEKNWDHLKILTKDEIIEYLKRNHYYLAPLSDSVRFFKRDKLIKEHQKKMEKHINDTRNQEWAKKADELAVKFNNETDTKKKLNYLEQRQKYINKLDNYHKEWRALDKEYEDIEKKYGRKD